MKEATGELNMTVITVIAIAAVAALFYAFVWPMIQRTIADRTCQTYGAGWHAVKGSGVATGEEKTSSWVCCPQGITSYDTTKCTPAE